MEEILLQRGYDKLDKGVGSFLLYECVFLQRYIRA